jgi:hypothetical protein
MSLTVMTASHAAFATAQVLTLTDDSTSTRISYL